MKKIVKRIRNLNDLLSLNIRDHKIQVSEATDDVVIKQIKRLHASTYLDLGFIDESELDKNGLIDMLSDPHQSHSTYFYVHTDDIERRILAIARQINTTNEGIESLPIFHKAKLDPDKHKKYLINLDPKKVVEISALIKKPGVSSLAPLYLYRKMLKISQAKGHTTWVMALDVNVYKKVKYQFGQTLHPIGGVSSYKGGDAIPLIMHIHKLEKQLLDQLHTSKYFQKRIRKELYQFFIGDKSEEFDLQID